MINGIPSQRVFDVCMTRNMERESILLLGADEIILRYVHENLSQIFLQM
jgi:hypothetical protein